MGKCPFLREAKEKTSVGEETFLLNCIEEECQIYDKSVGNCAIPRIFRKGKSHQEIEDLFPLLLETKEKLEENGRLLEDIERGLGTLHGLEKERNKEISIIVEKLDDWEEDLASLTFTLEKIHKFLEKEEERERKEEVEKHNNQGVTLYYQGALEAASKQFEKVIALDPTFIEAYNNLAIVYGELGRKEEAILNFKKVIELSPNFAEAYNNLGFLYKMEGDYEEAIRLFEAALERKENYALAYVNLGNAYYALRMREKAIAAWEKALSLDPSQEEARKMLTLVKGEFDQISPLR